MSKLDKIILALFIFTSGFLVFLGFTSDTNAYTTDDVVQRFFSVNPSGTNEYIIPDGKDLIIRYASVLNNENQPALVNVYDTGSLVFQSPFPPGSNVGEYNMYFQDSLKVTNTSTGSDLDIYYRGYLIDEGSVIEELNASDYLNNSIKFFESDDFKKLIMLVLVFIMFLMLFYLNIKWGFKTGIIFFKEKFIGRR